MRAGWLGSSAASPQRAMRMQTLPHSIGAVILPNRSFAQATAFLEKPHMHPVLNRNLFFVKEHLGIFKAANNYDIYDPQTNEQILHCREDNLGFFTKMLRFTNY